MALSLLVLSPLHAQTTLEKHAIDLQKVTIPDLQELVKSGKLTYKELTQIYLDRIELYDVNTIALNSVRMVNPNALEEAQRCDDAFASDPSVAKGLFGMPVLVKDNINVMGMPTTAGSVALADNYAPYDACIVTKIKESGAIILGKLNLTEFANYMTVGMPTGFSSLGGQVRNPYRPVPLLGDTITVRPSGSSAGSGVAAAAALSVITIGTDTSGSILSPSFASSVVGIRPTVGLVSRHGIIPLSSTQDTGGPMGRNVTDVAILLNVLVGYDTNDDMTKKIEEAGVTHIDYTQSLKLGDLKGKRIGLIGIPDEAHPAHEPFQEAINALRAAGAEIVTKPNGTALTYYNPDNPDVNPPLPSTIVMDWDFAKDLPAYLATLDENYPIKTLQDIIDFNNEAMKTNPDAFAYGQAVLLRCNDLDLEAQREKFMADRQTDILYSRVNGIDYLLQKHELDGLIGVSAPGSPLSPTLIVSKACYPTVSIPLANPGGATYPLNMAFTGTAFSEAQLIEFAYVVEQATNFRIPPGLADKSRLGAAIRAAQELSEDERASFHEILDWAFGVYHNNFIDQLGVDKAEEELRKETARFLQVNN
ncbi:MAG: amidase family protein [Bacteroidales bacterium]|nr:amidase family protein [Bacteroidales bacterium]